MRDRISAALKEAMLAKDKLRVSAIRLMMAAMKDRDIALRGEDGASGLDNAGVMALLAKMVKQREDSAEQYDKAARPELAEKERAEIEVLEGYLPEGASEVEIDAAVAKAVEETGATSPKDMGKVMKAAMAALAATGKAVDGKQVSALVRKKLGA